MRPARTNLVAGLLLGLLAWPGFAAEEAARPLLERLPEFRLGGIDGREFNSTERLGDRAAVITFWRVDQEPSLRLLKELHQIAGEVPEQDVAIISIVAGDVDRSRVKSVAKELKITFPVLFDSDREVFGQFGGIVSPSTWFVDHDGIVVDAYPGHRRDFLRVAHANVDFLRRRISESERAERIRAGRPASAEEEKDFAGARTRYRLAIRLLEKGQREAAAKQLRAIWERDSPFVQAGVKLGLLLLEQEQNAEALKILDRATGLDPSDPLAAGARAVALIRLGREQAGAGLLRAALQEPVDEPLLYYEMAKLSEKENALDEACRYYRTGLELVLAKPVAYRRD